jgi:hypothetical protein
MLHIHDIIICILKNKIPPSNRWCTKLPIFQSSFACVIRMASTYATILNKNRDSHLVSILSKSKKMPNNVIFFNSNTPTLYKACYPVTPLRWEPFDAQGLLEKTPLEFIRLLKIEFEKDPIQFLPMNLMDSLIKNYNPF